MKKGKSLFIKLLFSVVILLSMSFNTFGDFGSPNVGVLVAGNNDFAFDLYAKLKTENGNLFFSPYSISSALAMTYAGARGDTALQMVNVLHFNNLDEKSLNASFLELMNDLNASQEKNGYQLNIANALWGQERFDFIPQFIDITKTYYNSEFKTVDFRAPDKAAGIINQWVEDKTNEKIKNLISPLAIDAELTKLILTNAIYFKGNWLAQFKKEYTKNSPFTLINNEKVEVPMMNKTADFDYSENETAQVLELPYSGDRLSMVVILPKKNDGIGNVENLLSNENLNKWLASLTKREIIVYLPKFKIESSFSLNGVLINLGMKNAFTEGVADFSGINKARSSDEKLYIGEAVHKAFVDVNEEGTEAAAATAVIMHLIQSVSPEPLIFRADHSFIFIIRDKKTNSILFIGRIMNPRN